MWLWYIQTTELPSAGPGAALSVTYHVYVYVLLGCTWSSACSPPAKTVSTLRGSKARVGSDRVKRLSRGQKYLPRRIKRFLFLSVPSGIGKYSHGQVGGAAFLDKLRQFC